MNSFRYQAIAVKGSPVSGVIEAEDRRGALRILGERGLFPSTLEEVGARTVDSSNAAQPSAPPTAAEADGRSGVFRFGSGVKRKEITAFTREIASLLGASIPIPQALEGLGEEEENLVLRSTILGLAEAVRKGASLSSAMEEHPDLFSRLYCSMVRVGEESGALPSVMSDLAMLLEHEDEVRGEVVGAVAYPAFVLGFGIFTVVVLLTFVLPRLFTMLEDMLDTLPLPTRILLAASHFVQSYGLLMLPVLLLASYGLNRYFKTPGGAHVLDGAKLRFPMLGGLFRAAALGRFARTLGTLLKAGVSLLPALKIVENTIGNVVLAGMIARVAEETKGGDSLATPLRRLRVFPRNVTQMIDVGEETGRLDEMLLKVADIEERQMRAKTRTMISLLGPALILVVGGLVGFTVIALLLPIFKMSQAVH